MLRRGVAAARGPLLASGAWAPGAVAGCTPSCRSSPWFHHARGMTSDGAAMGSAEAGTAPTEPQASAGSGLSRILLLLVDRRSYRAARLRAGGRGGCGWGGARGSGAVGVSKTDGQQGGASPGNLLRAGDGSRGPFPVGRPGGRAHAGAAGAAGGRVALAGPRRRHGRVCLKQCCNVSVPYQHSCAAIDT